MTQEPLRFLQAGDFHLEQPLSGVEEVPDALRELFLEAPYRAATQVFDIALLEGVAFVVLTGDLLDPLLAGPRGLVFLAEQFTRLAEREIPVYWAGGVVDPPEAWPEAWPLPGNVHVFSRGRVDEFIYQRDGVPLARLLGTSRDKQPTIRAGEFHADRGMFTVAVAYGGADLPAIQARGINYWALGGRHERQITATTPTTIHYCGSPQGRHPGETGPHGCTLVEVDEQQNVRTSFLTTDVVRWFDERLPVEQSTTREDLWGRLRERTAALRQSAPQLDLLVTWTVAGAGPLLSELRRGWLARGLLDQLRSEFGSVRPAAWSVALTAEPSDALPSSWYEQEDLLGDFLRILRQWQVNPEAPLDFEAYLDRLQMPGATAGLSSSADATGRQAARGTPPDTLSALTAISAPPEREQVLREAILLGAELLGGSTEEHKEDQP